MELVRKQRYAIGVDQPIQTVFELTAPFLAVMENLQDLTPALESGMDHFRQYCAPRQIADPGPTCCQHVHTDVEEDLRSVGVFLYQELEAALGRWSSDNPYSTFQAMSYQADQSLVDVANGKMLLVTTTTEELAMRLTDIFSFLDIYVISNSTGKFALRPYDGSP